MVTIVTIVTATISSGSNSQTHLEGFPQFLVAVCLFHVFGHHLQKLFEVYRAITICVNLGLMLVLDNIHNITNWKL